MASQRGCGSWSWQRPIPGPSSAHWAPGAPPCSLWGPGTKPPGRRVKDGDWQAPEPTAWARAAPQACSRRSGCHPRAKDTPERGGRGPAVPRPHPRVKAGSAAQRTEPSAARAGKALERPPQHPSRPPRPGEGDPGVQGARGGDQRQAGVSQVEELQRPQVALPRQDPPQQRHLESLVYPVCGAEEEPGLWLRDTPAGARG
ncbi:Hypothetical predicted protein [Marmota monax]|uniref:Uncharacterized protein n=1 Tax=Marmota monax TaxID=9995 RepID=A0A5E4AGS6_MARMO|nr:hypothetical protein GHT09_006203 [Marmota monax]VTJ56567.1 Hypothetical predicted protein [Marmota monax]